MTIAVETARWTIVSASPVSLGRLSTVPSHPTIVEEPPPSRLIASTAPSAMSLSASSASVKPSLPRIPRPSQTSSSSFPSAVAPTAVRGWRDVPAIPPPSKTSRQ